MFPIVHLRWLRGLETLILFKLSTRECSKDVRTFNTQSHTNGIEANLKKLLAGMRLEAQQHKTSTLGQIQKTKEIKNIWPKNLPLS